MKIPCVVGFLSNFLFSNLPTLSGRVILTFLSTVMILRIALLVTSFSTFSKGRLFLFFGDFGEVILSDFGTFPTPAELFLSSSGLFLGPAEAFGSPKSMSNVSHPGFLTVFSYFWLKNVFFRSIILLFVCKVITPDHL